MNNAIQKMIKSHDFEVAYIGEQLWWHTEKYISELKQLGFARSEAEMGIVHFCNAVVSDVAHGKEVSFPHYREDLVKLIAEHCFASMNDGSEWRIAV